MKCNLFGFGQKNAGPAFAQLLFLKTQMDAVDVVFGDDLDVFIGQIGCGAGRCGCRIGVSVK